MVKVSCKLKKSFYIIIVCLFFFLVTACQQAIIPAPDNNGVIDETEQDSNIIIKSYLKVKGNPDIIKDCTPEFTIFTEKEVVKYMSFSGNGEDWTKWINYSENYDQFNIASGLNGTTMNSGLKSVYIHFKDKNGFVFPEDFQEPVCCKFNYEMQELFSIKVEPAVAEVVEGGSAGFMLKGYDLILNEVPLDSAKAGWTKGCGVGELNPDTGLSTTYTAPEISGVRDIAAHYSSLRVGAKIYITEN
jgi:hypothetical protein